jgi:hypothetical protein
MFPEELVEAADYSSMTCVISAQHLCFVQVPKAIRSMKFFEKLNLVVFVNYKASRRLGNLIAFL